MTTESAYEVADFPGGQWFFSRVVRVVCAVDTGREGAVDGALGRLAGDLRWLSHQAAHPDLSIPTPFAEQDNNPNPFHS